MKSGCGVVTVLGVKGVGTRRHMERSIELWNYWRRFIGV